MDNKKSRTRLKQIYWEQERGAGAATVLDEVAVLELEDGCCGQDEDTWYMRIAPAAVPGPPAGLPSSPAAG